LTRIVLYIFHIKIQHTTYSQWLHSNSSRKWIGEWEPNSCFENSSKTVSKQCQFCTTKHGI